MKVRLSASMIKDFLSCNRKAYYRIIKPESQTQTYQMAGGDIVHNALEKHWENIDAAIEYAKTEIQTRNLTKGISNIYTCITNYFSNFSSLVSETDKIEEFFRVPYSGLEIVGKFDRVTKEGLVIDWKTGATAPTDISGDLQFILYEYAYTKLYGVPPSKMYMVSLSRNRIIPYIRNDAFVDEFLNVTLPFVTEGLLYNVEKNLFVRTGLFGYNICEKCSFIKSCYKEIGV